MPHHPDPPVSRRELLQQAGAAALAVGAAGFAACQGGSALPGQLDNAADGAGSTELPTPDSAAPEAGPEISVEAVPETRSSRRLRPLRGDGSDPLHYLDTLVIVQMENRSFDHYFGSLSLLEGRKDVEGLVAGMKNLASDGSAVPIRHLDKEYVIDPDPPHDHESCLESWDEGGQGGFVTAWEKKLAGFTTPSDYWDRVMGYYVREQLPAHYTLADAFTLCDDWHCSLLGPTWPNRYYSHCATSGGLWTNGATLDAPIPYDGLARAGFDWRVYYHSLYFLLTINPAQVKPNAYIEHFYEDAAAGNLPNVTIVEPSFFYGDDHPPADIRVGQAFLASVYEALRSSPQWDRCLMVVFYDEHGGFFDHVAPPPAPGESRAGFDRLGFRVPAMLAGPLVKRGQVLHTTFEHCSVPRLVSKMFGLPFLNDRSMMAGDLSEALDLALVEDRPEAPPMPIIDLPTQALERARRFRCTQPALLEMATRLGHTKPLGERELRLERFLAAAQNLGAVRVTR